MRGTLGPWRRLRSARALQHLQGGLRQVRSPSLLLSVIDCASQAPAPASEIAFSEAFVVTHTFCFLSCRHKPSCRCARTRCWQPPTYGAKRHADQPGINGLFKSSGLPTFELVPGMPEPDQGANRQRRMPKQRLFGLLPLAVAAAGERRRLQRSRHASEPGAVSPSDVKCPGASSNRRTR